MKRLSCFVTLLLALACILLAGCGSSDSIVIEPPRVLLITAHPAAPVVVNLAGG